MGIEILRCSICRVVINKGKWCPDHRRIGYSMSRHDEHSEKTFRWGGKPELDWVFTEPRDPFARGIQRLQGTRLENAIETIANHHQEV